MASKNQNSTISVKKNGTFAMCINGIMRHFIVEVSAEVDADVTQASFRGNRYEPADPPGVSVTGAEVEMTFDGDDMVEGSLKFSGERGLNMFHHFWYDTDVHNEAVDSAKDDDDADYQYETQRELRDDYGPYGGDEQC